jgi:hypothetical protein
MKKRRKPISQRETIEVEGEKRRLNWIAENRPKVLIKRVEQGHERSHAYLSALHKYYSLPEMLKMIKRHPEWQIDIDEFQVRAGYLPPEQTRKKQKSDH